MIFFLETLKLKAVHRRTQLSCRDKRLNKEMEYLLSLKFWQSPPYCYRETTINHSVRKLLRPTPLKGKSRLSTGLAVRRVV